MNKTVASLIIMALTSTVASAADILYPNQITGKQLHSMCSSKNESTRCGSYIRGVVDTILFTEKHETKEQTICLPKGITDKQLVDNFKAKSKEEPMSIEFSGVFAIGVSLDSYPCKK